MALRTERSCGKFPTLVELAGAHAWVKIDGQHVVATVLHRGAVVQTCGEGGIPPPIPTPPLPLRASPTNAACSQMATPLSQIYLGGAEDILKSNPQNSVFRPRLRQGEVLPIVRHVAREVGLPCTALTLPGLWSPDCCTPARQCTRGEDPATTIRCRRTQR